MEQVETVVGYACLPLYITAREETCLIDDGSYRLRINTATPLFEAPARVETDGEEQDDMTLSVRVQSLSSIHAAHALARRLIDAHASCAESREGAEEHAKAAVLGMIASPRDVQKSAAASCDFGSLADALFAFVAMPVKELAEASFQLLVELVDHTCGKHYRHPIPAWYIHHLNTFHDDGRGAVPLHDSLCDLLADWITDEKFMDNAKRQGVHMWFFFDAIAKSVANSGCSPGTAERFAGAHDQKTEAFDPAKVVLSNDSVIRLTQAVAALVTAALSTHPPSMQRLNRDFALFTKDLLSLSASGRNAMLAYLAQLDEASELSEIKWEYISIVADHEHWLQLKLLDVVLPSAVGAIKSGEPVRIGTAMSAFCEILTKHSFDANSNPRVETARSQQQQFNAATIGAEYFPFVIEVLDCVEHGYWAAPEQVNTDLLSSLLFIMQSLGPWGLYSWLEVESERRLRVLLRVLEVATTRFECLGRRADLSFGERHRSSNLLISARTAVLTDDSENQSYTDRLETVYSFECASSEAHYLTVLDVLTSFMDVHGSLSVSLDGLAPGICKVLVCMLARRNLPLAVGFRALECLEHYLLTFAEVILSPHFTSAAELSHSMLLLCSTNGREFRSFRQQAAFSLFRYVQLSILIMGRVSFPLLSGTCSTE